MKNLSYCISKKELNIKKSDKVQGSVCIHFPDNSVKDIVLTNDLTVDVFGRIAMTPDLVKKSNLQMLLNQGAIVLV